MLGQLTLIGIMLEKNGFQSLQAQNAYAALDILRSTTPDLIILDVMMPGMNGIELCEHIRKMDTMRDTPIIILSARGDPTAVEQGMAAGADDYLQKPVLQHDLVSKIREHLDVTEEHG